MQNALELAGEGLFEATEDLGSATRAHERLMPDTPLEWLKTSSTDHADLRDADKTVKGAELRVDQARDDLKKASANAEKMLNDPKFFFLQTPVDPSEYWIDQTGYFTPWLP